MTHPLDRSPIIKGVNLALIAALCDSVYRVPGDFIEFGIYNGASLRVIKDHAQLRDVIAVDSFEGLSKSDNPDEDARFPEGAYKSTMTPGQVADRFNVTVYADWIPGVLNIISTEQIAFAHVDLDHMDPTASALNWTWERLSDGGVVCVHDFYWHDWTSASGAVNLFMDLWGLRPVGVCDTSIWFKKGVS